MITKLVLPVAGNGTRLRPLTLRTPKALVELGGKPLVEYILEEAAASGIREVFFIISPIHRRHFARYLVRARRRFPRLSFMVRVQREAYGNGHALLQIADCVGRKPFAVRFCDDVIVGKKPALAALMGFFKKHRTTVLALTRVPKNRITSFGVVSVRRMIAPAFHDIRLIMEKPAREDIETFRLSNLTIVGAYILMPEIMKELREIGEYAPRLPDALPLTAAFHRVLAGGGTIYGWEFPGARLDCGNLNGFRKAERFLKK